MTKYISIIILITLFLSCKSNKETNHTAITYEPVKNSIQFNLKESDTIIGLKWLKSDEILYDYYYKMYKDDTLIERIKKYYDERLEFDRKYATRTPFIKWLKKQAANLQNDIVFISEKHFEGEIWSIKYYVEIEHENNSSYYVFRNQFSQPIFKVNNMKKGYIKNQFDTIVKYENTRIEKEKPLPRIITGDNPWLVSKFEKSYITTARNLQFSNSRYKQIAYLSSRIDSIIYRKETGLDIDSIVRIEKIYVDSFNMANGL